MGVKKSLKSFLWGWEKPMQKAWGETAGWLEVLKADCHFSRAAKRESGKREQGRFNHQSNWLKSPHNFTISTK